MRRHRPLQSRMNRPRLRNRVSALCLLVSLGACQTIDEQAPDLVAQAMMLQPDGTPTGAFHVYRGDAELTASLIMFNQMQGPKSVLIVSPFKCDSPEEPEIREPTAYQEGLDRVIHLHDINIGPYGEGTLGALLPKSQDHSDAAGAVIVLPSSHFQSNSYVACGELKPGILITR